MCPPQSIAALNSPQFIASFQHNPLIQNMITTLILPSFYSSNLENTPHTVFSFFLSLTHLEVVRQIIPKPEHSLFGFVFRSDQRSEAATPNICAIFVSRCPASIKVMKRMQRMRCFLPGNESNMCRLLASFAKACEQRGMRANADKKKYKGHGCEKERV